MESEDFVKFVDKTIDELLLLAQVYTGTDYSNFKLEFHWSELDSKTIAGREIIVQEITRRVFLSSDKIYPCVDLIIEQLSDEPRLNITGIVAGFEPRPFQNGWSNRPGPFIYGVGTGIIGKVNSDTDEFRSRLISLGLLHEKKK